MKTSDLRFMSSSLHKIEEQARSLSAEDRANLAEFMMESLHTSIEEIEAAWSEEIALRIDAVEMEIFLRILLSKYLQKPVRFCSESCSIC
jgi:hypothetical protein